MPKRSRNRLKVTDLEDYFPCKKCTYRDAEVFNEICKGIREKKGYDGWIKGVGCGKKPKEKHET